MKTIILARVSTEEQKEAGNSLPAQQARLVAYIERTPELILDHEFIFDESAYKEKRSEFSKVLTYLDSFKEIVALCCDKVDRVSRDFLIGLPELEKRRREGKIELHFPSDNLVLHKDSPATDLFHFNIAVSLAQYFSNAISDNTKRVLEQRRRNGEWNGKPRIGYMNITLENEKKDIVLDPERADFIKKIFKLYATGNYSLLTVSEEVTKMGLRNKKGEILHRSGIEKILKDTFYYGMAYSKTHNLYYPHRYMPLITKELFDKCQLVLHKRFKNPSKQASRPYIFKGLLRCKNCGCLYTPEIHKGCYIYYSCTNAKGNCERMYVSEKDLLKPIYDVFKAFENIPEHVHKNLVEKLRLSSNSTAIFHKRQIERIRSEYDRNKQRMDTLLNLRLDQGIASDVFDTKLTELKDSQQKLNIELEEYTNANYEYHIHVSTVISLAKRVREIFESSEVDEKRALLAFLLQNPTMQGKNLDFSLLNPFNLVLELAQCPSWYRYGESNSDFQDENLMS